jgi:2-(1,2-epoxy-1,2-dihydrophenyl)acetyl-CoA isomerase
VSSNILTDIQNKVMTITLNDPQTRNAFSLDMAGEFLKAIEAAVKNETIRCIILTGSDPAFSAGGNIKLMAQTKGLKQFFLDISEILHKVATLFRKTDKIVIGAINGPVSGVAFGLVLSTDIRFAAKEATLHAGTTLIGLAPNGSATYFLPRLVGTARAAEILITGKKITAEEAEKIGLINKVAPKNSLLKEVQGYAACIAEGAPIAQAKIKALLNTTWENSLDQQLEAERQAIADTGTTQDFQEGIQSFLAKRPPQFKGK